jgi:hypothetical protein
MVPPRTARRVCCSAGGEPDGVMIGCLCSRGNGPVRSPKLPRPSRGERVLRGTSWPRRFNRGLPSRRAPWGRLTERDVDSILTLQSSFGAQEGR